MNVFFNRSIRPETITSGKRRYRIFGNWVTVWTMLLAGEVAANVPPVASNDSFVIDEDQVLSGLLSGSDSDGDALAFRVIASPAHGTLYVSKRGAFSYRPGQNEVTPISFEFVVNDGQVDSPMATVTVNITPANDAPIPTTGMEFSGSEDTDIVGSLSAVDPESDTIVFLMSAEPRFGTLDLDPSGGFVYYPFPDFNGIDGFQFIASDGSMDSPPARCVLDVNAVDDSPVAPALALSVPGGRTLSGQLNGSDGDGDKLTYHLNGTPSGGTASVETDGRFLYTPEPGFEGSDSFSYIVEDGTGLSASGSVSVMVANDTVGALGDLLHSQITGIDFSSGALQFSESVLDGLADGIVDLQIDAANRILCALTDESLEIFDLDTSVSPPQLTVRDSVAVRGTRLSLSPDGRTVYVGGMGKVTSINLYPEDVLTGIGVVRWEPYQNKREYAFLPADRAVAAMGVHPGGDRLIVVIGMDPRDEKLAINNNLLRSDVGNGSAAADVVLPDDFGYITQLDIRSDLQTEGPVRAPTEFAESVGIKELVYPEAVAIGIKSLAFSPDGNYVLLAAVGAQTPRATPFGIMPTSDEGTGGIVVLDLREKEGDPAWVRFLEFVATVEEGEDTAALRRQVQREGWNIVHPEVQWARGKYLEAWGQLDTALSFNNPFLSQPRHTGFIVAAQTLDLLERSYVDYGYMEAYSNLYPRDMVGASGVAINRTGDFGVVTMQDTNNLGLLKLDLSAELEGYGEGALPQVSIFTGTGKTINGFNPALTPANPNFKAPQSAYSWAYPQEVVFTSDDTRIHIGMAGGTPRTDLTNRFGSADALALRSEAERVDSIFKSSNPPAGYTPYSGPALKSPRQVAALNAFDTDGDGLSDRLEAYNRWNTFKTLPDAIVDPADPGDSVAKRKRTLISTAPESVSHPAVPSASQSAIVDCLDYGYLLPPSGVGYRLNTFGLPEAASNFATKGLVAAIEELGRRWDGYYRKELAGAPDAAVSVSRPYFVVGLLSQPGGGKMQNRAHEPLKYHRRNGFEADFPYLSEGSDSPHDFLPNNAPPHLTDNSGETAVGFDASNTAALLSLLLADPRVSRIELDPYVLDLLPEFKADPRLVPHGSRRVADSRRDLDDHMFVTFECLAADLDLDTDGNGRYTPWEDTVEESPDTRPTVAWAGVGNTDATTGDMDEIPDYADGYGLFGPDSTNAGVTLKFTPLVVRIPEGLDLGSLEFSVTYAESSPAAVTQQGNAPDFEYELPLTGAFRVWTRDGGVSRQMAEIDAGGDFIASGKKYSVGALSLSPQRTVTLYIESVGPHGGASEDEVTFELFVDGGAQSSVVAVMDGVRIAPARFEMTEIRGLYAPKNPSTPFDGDYGEYRADYLSEDDLGRVYANREPLVNPDGTPNENPDGTPIWKAGANHVELTVATGMRAPSSEYSIRWEYLDPDDGSNQGMNAVASMIVDPNDDTNSDGIPDADVGDDNLKPIAHWEEIPGLIHAQAGFQYLIREEDHTDLGYERKRAYTQLDANGLSKIRFRTSSAGGDNYQVRATLLCNGVPDTSVEAITTGEMTVWKLIHLEVDQTPGGKLFPMNDINDRYEATFVHWDVQPVTTNPHDTLVERTDGTHYYFGQPPQPPGTPQPPNSPPINTNSKVSVQNDAFLRGTDYAKKHFDHWGVPGWYYMLSTQWDLKDDWVNATPTGARENTPIGPPVAFSTSPTTKGASVVAVSGDLRTYIDKHGNPISPAVGDSIIFWDKSGGQLESRLVGINYDPHPVDRTEFEVVSKIPYSFMVDNADYVEFIDLQGHGLSLSNIDYISHATRLQALPSRGKAAYAAFEHDSSGQRLKDLTTGLWLKRLFVNRCFIFCKGAVTAEKETAYHELGHTLGMAHQCGNYTIYSSPVSEKSCALNRHGVWLRQSPAPGSPLVPNSGAVPRDGHFCADHVVAMRLVDLSEDGDGKTYQNRRLNWK